MQTQPSRFPLFLKILILYLIKPPLMRASSLEEVYDLLLESSIPSLEL